MNLYLLKIWLLAAGTYFLGLGLWGLSFVNANTTSEQGGYIALTLVVTSFLSTTSFVAVPQIDDWL